MAFSASRSLLAGLMMTWGFASNNALAYATEDEKVETACIQRAQWIDPDGLKPLDGQSLMKEAAKADVVLLGEQHPDAVHHRWQLQTITKLFAHNPNIVLGFEMFPRRVQPALDAWIRGELTEREFLSETDWDEVWKHDAEIYMPLFRFARMNRLPMIALNVEMSLISEVGQNGWDAVDEAMKEGVQTPRDAHPDYIKGLKAVFSAHDHIPDEDKDPEAKKQANSRFNNFVDAQLTWDGAMAQEIARVQKLGGDPLVIGVMGTGHLNNRYGVPHQLEGLGLGSTVLIPWTLGWDCAELTPTFADAIFGLEEPDPEPERQRPLLGVRIAGAEDVEGVLVEQTLEETVAEDAGLMDGDIITKAAGLSVKEPAELVGIIQRQAPGTWLPLEVMRDGAPVEIIAKFPPAAPL